MIVYGKIPLFKNQIFVDNYNYIHNKGNNLYGLLSKVYTTDDLIQSIDWDKIIPYYVVCTPSEVSTSRLLLEIENKIKIPKTLPTKPNTEVIEDLKIALGTTNIVIAVKQILEEINSSNIKYILPYISKENHSIISSVHRIIMEEDNHG